MRAAIGAKTQQPLRFSVDYPRARLVSTLSCHWVAGFVIPVRDFLRAVQGCARGKTILRVLLVICPPYLPNQHMNRVEKGRGANEVDLLALLEIFVSYGFCWFRIVAQKRNNTTTNIAKLFPSYRIQDAQLHPQ